MNYRDSLWAVQSLGGAGGGPCGLLICLTWIPRIANNSTHPYLNVGTKAHSGQEIELYFCLDDSNHLFMRMKRSWQVGQTRISDSWLWSWDEMFACSLSCLFLSSVERPHCPEMTGMVALGPLPSGLGVGGSQHTGPYGGQGFVCLGEWLWVVEGAVAVEQVGRKAAAAAESWSEAQGGTAGRGDAGRREEGRGDKWALRAMRRPPGDGAGAGAGAGATGALTAGAVCCFPPNRMKQLETF